MTLSVPVSYPDTTLYLVVMPLRLFLSVTVSQSSLATDAFDSFHEYWLGIL